MKLLLKNNYKSSFQLDPIAESGYDLNGEFQRIHRELINKEKYAIALELCKITGLDSSEVILVQVKLNFPSSIISSFVHSLSNNATYTISQYRSEINKSKVIDNGFWQNCARDFKTYGVPSEKAAEFFIEHAKTVACHHER